MSKSADRLRMTTRNALQASLFSVLAGCSGSTGGGGSAPHDAPTGGTSANQSSSRATGGSSANRSASGVASGGAWAQGGQSTLVNDTKSGGGTRAQGGQSTALSGSGAWWTGGAFDFGGTESTGTLLVGGASSSATGGRATGGLSSAGGGRVTGGSPTASGGSTTGPSSAAGGGVTSAPTGGSVGTGGITAAGSGGRLVTGGTRTTGDSGSPMGGESSSGGKSATDSGPAEGISITNLEVEGNPNNVLSCFVTWTTSIAASSVVQFGSGQYQFEIEDTNEVTSHRVLVIGMRASDAYLIKAISRSSAGSAEAESTFTTGSLPDQVPVATVNVYDTERSLAGWTLMNIQKGDGTASARSTVPGAAVMYDSEGQPVWYYINGTNPDIGGAVSVDRTNDGILIGPASRETPKEVDLAGNILWECSDPQCGTTSALSHHAGKLSNGNYIVLGWISAGRTQMPVFYELTPQKQIVWSLDMSEIITPPSNASGDWCHGNSVTVDLENDAVYLSCRWIGLVKVTRSTRRMQWWMPASYNAEALGDVRFSPAESQYIDIHDPEIHTDDGTILFYENGGYSGVFNEEGNPHGYHARAVEYAVDEVAKTATLVWEFPGSFPVDAWYATAWYNQFWGDANRLSNGNVIITAGVRGPNSRSRIFEVTRDGRVVWEFLLPNDFGVYRSTRVSAPVKSL